MQGRLPPLGVRALIGSLTDGEKQAVVIGDLQGRIRLDGSSEELPRLRPQVPLGEAPAEVIVHLRRLELGFDRVVIIVDGNLVPAAEMRRAGVGKGRLDLPIVPPG